MHIYEKITAYILNFLFPKKEEVLLLEKLDSIGLSSFLPSGTKPMALFQYQDPRVRELIWEIKYTGNKKLIHTCTSLLLDLIVSELSDRILFESASWETHTLLIPMPISKKRRLERGYNQTELIAEALIISNSSLVYEPNLLLKIVHTESQARTHASKQERMRNLSHSMQVFNTSKIAGKNIILLDDVTTSGASFEEASRALFAAGAKRIIPIALAH